MGYSGRSNHSRVKLGDEKPGVKIVMFGISYSYINKTARRLRFEE
jgi:hypothetical protein